MTVPHDTASILAGLKDFQRRTAEYAFHRLYTDTPPTTRFLIADEVGLGKTHVAKGIIAQAVDHLRSRGVKRIDIVYICSSQEIAAQNLSKLALPGVPVAHASRLTLLPLNLRNLAGNAVNFIAFTPGTSWNLANNAGRADERVLLFHLLMDWWTLPAIRTAALRILEGDMGREQFAAEVGSFQTDHCDTKYPDRPVIDPTIAGRFVDAVAALPELRAEFEKLRQDDRCKPRAAELDDDFVRLCKAFVGKLRRVLANVCLDALEPDLVILDEFQRFKEFFIQQDDDQPINDLARQMIEYSHPTDGPARVLLLSATPYKMYTEHRATEDDHHADFWRTMQFLLPDEQTGADLRRHFQRFREEYSRGAGFDLTAVAAARDGVETILRRVMARTEKLVDGHGLLQAKSVPMTIEVDDVHQYVALQNLADLCEHSDIMDYWKSAPYLLSFMDDYDLKRKFHKYLKDDPAAVRKALMGAPPLWLSRDDLEAFRKIKPANARLRALQDDTVRRGAWKLLWLPPARAYYTAPGPWNDEALAGFTKRLIFSAWKVAPKAIAAMLSYEAERLLFQDDKLGNTKEAREKRRESRPLAFAESGGRLTGLPVLGLIYPCRLLADSIDPLRTAAATPSLEDVWKEATKTLEEPLARLAKQYQRTEGGRADRNWYWAAPLLMDLEHDPAGTKAWFANPNLAQEWQHVEDDDTSEGWVKHVARARSLVNGRMTLGPQPANLSKVVARLALGAPGVVILRALRRIDGTQDWRGHAAPMAHAFLHLFNLPESRRLVEHKTKGRAYWLKVARYAARGNLQAVMDEYVHLYADEPPEKLQKNVIDALTLRASRVEADIYKMTRQGVKVDPERFSFACRFAMRFGVPESSVDGGITRADQLRTAFNSPFRPFVLASTSVGQEGLDFHHYCHAVVHWNLPSNPVDLEQREGRVHRYKSHAVRKNHAVTLPTDAQDPWRAVFEAAATADGPLIAHWLTAGATRIERHVPLVPQSRDAERLRYLEKALVLYRMVFGQNRQEDLVQFLATHLNEAQIDNLRNLCRIDLRP